MTRPASRTRRGQIQFGETIMVVVVIVFILIVGIVFYFNASKASVEKQIRTADQAQSMTVVNNILSLPEIGCDPSVTTGRCVDLLKLKHLAGQINCGSSDPTSRYYCSLFGAGLVTVTIVDAPPASGPTSFLFYNSSLPNSTATDSQFRFTTVYDPVGGEQLFAYFNVSRYQQGVTFG